MEESRTNIVNELNTNTTILFYCNLLTSYAPNVQYKASQHYNLKL